MNWSLIFAPLVPLPVLAAAAVAVLIVVIPGILRRARGAWLRTMAAAALVAALANPVLLNEDRESLPTVVALVVDGSASQSLDGRDSVTAAAAETLAVRLGEFAGVEVRTIDAGGSVAGAAVDGTALFGPLATALSDVPPERLGAVVMLTDGQVHDAPADAGSLPSAPLHVLLSGREGEEDRRIVIEAAPRFGIVNESQVIRYRVIDEGTSPAGPARVAITHDGEPLGLQTVTPGTTAEIVVDITHGGPNVIEFEAEPLEDELTLVNNRAAVSIEGIRENLRVLLVSGEPHAGERTWRNLLKSDASVDLVHFTILRPPEKQDGTPINQLSLIAFPTRELFSEKIDQFDLIIFDRYQHRGVLPLLYFDNIARYVRDGGALLVAAGPDYAEPGSLYDTPLAPVLPASPTGLILEEPYHARVAGPGERHPVTRGLDGSSFDPPHWGRFFRLIDVDRPEGDVVMEGPGERPLLVLNRMGDGRVALLLSDHAWLWARGYEGGGPHVDLLRRLAHWLMKEPDLEEESLRAYARAGNLLVEQQTMAEESSPTIVRHPDGREEEIVLVPVSPGLWRASVLAAELGLYRVEQDDRRAFAHVGAANPREFIDVRSTDEILRPLAEPTRGYVGRMADASGNLQLPRIVPVRSSGTTAGGDWMGIRVTEASTLKGISRVPLFYGFVGLFGVAGLFGLLALLGLPFATWLREGR